MRRDTGLDTLLDMDGSIIDQGDGYWVKIEACKVDPSNERPHGIKYSLTLHDPYGKRLMGFDNAHAAKPRRREKYIGQKFGFDHQHRHVKDRGVPYKFIDPYQLIEDFFHAVDQVLKAHRDE